MSWFGRLFGDRIPAGFTGTLEDDEHVLASAGDLVATSRGLWLPSDSDAAGPRRVGWHLVSKATWADDELTVVEAAETGTAGEAVLIADQPAQRFRLAEPGKLPAVVRQRVNASISSRYHKELPGGGAWFVQRKAPGGPVLQVRADPGADAAVVADIAREAAAKLGAAW